MPLFNLGEGIEWGQRMTGFSLCFLAFVAIFVFHLLGKVESSTVEVAFSAICGYGVGLGIGRGIEKANGKGGEDG